MLVALTGCQWASTEIRTDAVQSPVAKVVKRHDSYTTDQVSLQESAQLLDYSQSESIERGKFSKLLTPVADRHDRFVQNDDELSELKKRTYLRTTELLRKVAKRE